MKPSSILIAQRDQLMEIAARHGASSVRVFGSVARGEDTEDSDIDLLVELEPERTLWDLGEFLVEARELLGCKVDCVTPGGLHKLLKERILREAVLI